MVASSACGPGQRGEFAYGSYVDEVLGYVTGRGPEAQLYYAHANHLFSVAALTGERQADGAVPVVERYSYNAYGKQTITGPSGGVRAKSAVGWDRGFTGYYLDAETGLFYARNRMYSPGLGRFIGRDPTEYIDGYSLYRAYFVPNHRDPMGNKCEAEKARMDDDFQAFTYASGVYSAASANEQGALSRAGQAQQQKQQLQEQFNQCLQTPNASCTSLASQLGNATRAALTARWEWEGARDRARQAQQNLQPAQANFDRSRGAYERCMAGKGFYCTYGSSAVNICCDVISVTGYFLPGPGSVVSVTASIVSIANGVIYAAWCGPDPSTASSALDEAADLAPAKFVSVKYKILCNAVDISINVYSMANQ